VPGARPARDTARRVLVAAQAGVAISTGDQDDIVERAFSTAAADGADPARLDDLLDALSRGRLWLPLPGDGCPVTDGSAVHLPTIRFLGGVFIPAYTSAARLLRALEETAAGQRVTVLPHAVVRAADLARRLPPPLGIALNPAGPQSVPVYPAGVAYLAAQQAVVAGSRVSVGPLPAPPADLLTTIRAALARVRAAREAAAVWLRVDQAGEGMVIAVTLDDPGDAAARDATLAAVQAAADATPLPAAGALDVTFPGEDEPNVIDRWVTTFATPFYQRPASPPAPRPTAD
jgi:SseB protein N-terminal domain